MAATTSQKTQQGVKYLARALVNQLELDQRSGDNDLINSVTELLRFEIREAVRNELLKRHQWLAQEREWYRL